MILFGKLHIQTNNQGGCINKTPLHSYNSEGPSFIKYNCYILLLTLLMNHSHFIKTIYSFLLSVVLHVH